MKTRTNKLYHNLTKKKHKKFSRKKKTYKNKTLKGGASPLLIGLLSSGGVLGMGGVAAWSLYRRGERRKEDAQTPEEDAKRREDKQRQIDEISKFDDTDKIEKWVRRKKGRLLGK